MDRWVIVLLIPMINLGLVLPQKAPIAAPYRSTLRSGERLEVVHTEYDVTPSDRDLCPETEANKPPNRVYSQARVEQLRAAMVNTTLTGGTKLSAYIIHFGDQHLGSVTDYDRRLQFISGFSGSSGYAAVTATRAALWTDGRYFLQADQQMDCGWTMMKMATAGYPTLIEWLQQEVNNGVVGADPKLVSISNWLSYSDSLDMYEVTNDLIDQIWTEDRPARLNNLLDVHNLSFAGMTWQTKVSNVRKELSEKGLDAFVITALDETAWLFNLRGRDRQTTPLFDSYAIITPTDTRLYIRNITKLLTSAVSNHLNTNDVGTCDGLQDTCVKVHEYSETFSAIRELTQRSDVNRTLVSPSSNYAVYSAAGDKREVANSPIALMKSIKNPVERENYYKCQVRDSAAVVEFASFLEKEMAAGKHWTEVSAATKVTEIRSTYEYNWGISFLPISSVGSNAAVIHYRPDNTTDRTISTSEVYLLDSGGQYQDGTTDVTRTFHFGTPTDEEKEAYTRVLMAHIDLATTVWPAGLKGNDIDARTRASLWERGWDYRHGTGHGIGAFLQVHEGPARLGLGYQGPQYEALYAGMFFSDEPGFYRDGKYGIRIESIMEIVVANTMEKFGNVDYLTFHPATLVPFEPKFILVDMLNAKQRRWVNAYNKRCLEETGGLLQRQNKKDAYEWVRARTAYIPDVPSWGDGVSSSTSCSLNLQAFISALTLFIASFYFL